MLWKITVEKMGKSTIFMGQPPSLSIAMQQITHKGNQQITKLQNGKSPILRGKSTINHHFQQLSMSNDQRVYTLVIQQFAMANGYGALPM